MACVSYIATLPRLIILGHSASVMVELQSSLHDKRSHSEKGRDAPRCIFKVDDCLGWIHGLDSWVNFGQLKRKDQEAGEIKGFRNWTEGKYLPSR